MVNFSVILQNDTILYTVNSSFITFNESYPKGNIHVLKTVLLSVILGCIVLVTICGNVLVLLAVYVNSHLRSTTNYFIVNLAVADLLLGITVLPFSATLETMQYWPFGYIVCDLWASADVLWCTASIMTLCVISIDRYIGVTRPLQHSTIISEKRALLIIISVWVLSIIISIAPLIGWKETNNDSQTCTVTKQTGYVLFSVSGSFYIPMLIIIIVYTKIYREATKHSKYLIRGIKTTRIDDENDVVLRIHTGRCSQANIHTYQSSSSSEHSEGSARKLGSKMTLAGKIAKFKREKKAAKTLGIVVGVFIICWFPFFFCLPLDVLCQSCRVPSELFTAIFWLGYCNSLMNPIIYASSSKEFKRAFVRVLRCQWQRKPRLFMSQSNNFTTELKHYTTVDQHGDRRCHSVIHKLTKTDISNTNLSLACKQTDQKNNSLRVHHDQWKRSSISQNYNPSMRSSFSDLVTDEYSESVLHDCDNQRTNQASRLDSFSKDENYINAFRCMNSHAVL